MANNAINEKIVKNILGDVKLELYNDAKNITKTALNSLKKIGITDESLNSKIKDFLAGNKQVAKTFLNEVEKSLLIVEKYRKKYGDKEYLDKIKERIKLAKEGKETRKTLLNDELESNVAPKQSVAVFIDASLRSTETAAKQVKKYLANPVSGAEKAVDHLYNGLITIITAILRGLKTSVKWVYTKAVNLYNNIIALIKSAWVGLKHWWADYSEERAEDEDIPGYVAKPGKKYKKVDENEYELTLLRRKEELEKKQKEKEKKKEPAAFIFEKAKFYRKSIMEAEENDWVKKFETSARGISYLKKSLTIFALSVFILSLCYLTYIENPKNAAGYIAFESKISLDIASINASILEATEAEEMKNAANDLFSNVIKIIVWPFKSAFKAIVGAINMIQKRSKDNINMSDVVFVLGVIVGTILLILSLIAFGDIIGKHYSKKNKKK